MKKLACVAVVMAAVIALTESPYFSEDILTADPDAGLDFMGMCRHHEYEV